MIKKQSRKGYASGIEALANGDFDVVLGKHEKEVWGLIDGKKVLLIWDTRGKQYNPKWKVEAVGRFKKEKEVNND